MPGSHAGYGLDEHSARAACAAPAAAVYFMVGGTQVNTPAQEAALSSQYVCQFFEEHDGLCAVRFCTSWSTRDEDVDALCASIAQL